WVLGQNVPVTPRSTTPTRMPAAMPAPSPSPGWSPDAALPSIRANQPTSTPLPRSLAAGGWGVSTIPGAGSARAPPGGVTAPGGLGFGAGAAGNSGGSTSPFDSMAM